MKCKFQDLIDDGTVSDVVRNEAGEIVKMTLHEYLKPDVAIDTIMDHHHMEIKAYIEKIDELNDRIAYLEGTLDDVMGHRDKIYAEKLREKAGSEQRIAELEAENERLEAELAEYKIDVKTMLGGS